MVAAKAGGDFRKCPGTVLEAGVFTFGGREIARADLPEPASPGAANG